MSRGYVNITTEVDVDISPDDLASEGYHHEDDCPAKTGRECAHPDRERIDDAIDDLHRQAGHGDFPVYVCTVEPCRSLYLVPAGQVTQESIRRRAVA